MNRFRFPDLCSHCAACSADRQWSVTRVERHGNYQTTYYIPVPVCTGCASSLRTRKALSWAGALFLAFLAFNVVTMGYSNIAGLIAAVVAFLVGGLTIPSLAGLNFASIGRGGASMRFANRKYQATFDRLNATNLTL